MAYFDTTSPAGILSREITATRNVLAAIGRGIHRVMHAMVENATVMERMRRVQALHALSDEDLAKRGIRREDIVRNVFSDMYHL